jgi:predicted Zn-dependent protease
LPTVTVLEKFAPSLRRPIVTQTLPRFISPLLVAAALLGGVGCATNPVSGTPDLVLISEEEEVEIGKEYDKAIVGQFGLVNDPALERYVDGLGQRLAEVGHRPQLDYKFRVLDDPLVNAFALPGGYVYITRGILAHLQSEAALAGVMGHEVGHITARHGIRRASKDIIYNVITAPIRIVGIFFRRIPGLVDTIVGGSTALFSLKFSRDDERESDELGVEYGTELGYDTREMGGFFKVMQGLEERAGADLPEWFRTHPSSDDRADDVKELSEEAQAEKPDVKAWKVEDASFRRRLEGMVVGRDPRQGFLEGGRFKHPVLELEFPTPRGWKGHNSASFVAFVDPDGDALLLFALAKANTLDGAVEEFAGQGIKVLEETNLEVGGWPAKRVRSRPSQSEDLAITSTFVRTPRALVAFHAVSSKRGRAQQALMVNSADGLKQLTERAALERQPVVIKLVEARQAGPLRKVLEAYPIPPAAEMELIDLGLMNGGDLDAHVKQGELVKVLVVRGG